MFRSFGDGVGVVVVVVGGGGGGVVVYVFDLISVIGRQHTLRHVCSSHTLEKSNRDLLFAFPKQSSCG